MASRIDNSRINAGFPVAGQNNDSQGFRDNFANIKLGLGTANSEITELQNSSVLKSPVGGSTIIDNDLDWTPIKRAQLTAPSHTYTDLDAVSGITEIDYLMGSFQRMRLNNNIILNMSNFPPLGQAGRVVLWFSITNSTYKVLLPENVAYGVDRNTQIVNKEIVFPDVGDYLVEVASVDGGITYWLIDFANLGGSGGSGGSGDGNGFTGSRGATGINGATGPTGQFGGVTLAYKFKSIIADADPGNGFLSFDSTDLASATRLYIDKQDINGDSVQGYLQTIDDSTSTLKGHFKISNRLNADDFTIFTINSLVDVAGNTGYFKVSCNYLSGSTSYSSLEDVIITFARTGDIGATGARGYTGSRGQSGAFAAYGATGATGIPGPQGATGLGATGAQGVPGPQGDTGYVGSEGNRGYTGSAGPQGIDGQYAGVGYTGSLGASGPLGYSGSRGLPGVAIYAGATGPTGTRGATGPIGATGMSGATGSAGIGVWSDFELGVASPIPTLYSRPNTTAFNAYNSTDFPGPFFVGLSINAQNAAAQLAMNWNSEEEPPTGLYFRANDDTGDTASWSPWKRVLTDNGLITPSAGMGTDAGIKFPNDPAGGSGDTAWIRYYAYSNEKTTLEIGVSNDAIATTSQDSINLISPGGVGINKQQPSYKLDVTGDIHASGDIIAFSDATLKTSVKTISDPLELLSRLRGVYYNKIDTGEPGTGVIAQEVEDVLPMLVKTNNEGLKSVNYGNFAGVFIESIKALQQQVNDLTAEVARLKGKE
jgi:hypothetical protein